MASDSRIASRYAKSLMSLGIEQKNLETIYKDMIAIDEAMALRDFNLFIKSPIIKADKKQSVFQEVFANSLSPVSLNFFNILSRKGREFFLADIAKSFIQQYKKLNKITEVKLTTAKPLGSGAIEQIQKVLSASSETENTIEISSHVNPDLIGGFVIEFDDKLYDASVSHKLEQIKKNFID